MPLSGLKGVVDSNLRTFFMQVATSTDADASIGAFTFSIMLAKESELALLSSSESGKEKLIFVSLSNQHCNIKAKIHTTFALFWYLLHKF